MELKEFKITVLPLRAKLLNYCLLYTSGIINPPTRKDIHVYRINAMDAANEMNNAKAFNMIVLGGLLKIKPMVKLDSVLRLSLIHI